MFPSRAQRNNLRSRALHTFPDGRPIRNVLLQVVQRLRLWSVLKYPGEIDTYSVPDDAPDVSIIIPTYNNFGLTMRCIDSIRTHPIKVSYEIIVVDDASGWLHRHRLPKVSGIRVIQKAQNEGYLLACNAGLAHARGTYTVFLNNDTRPQAGWLDALVQNFSDPTVGLVGSQLVYPNGRLQEAGGIIFSDGSTANYGRGGNPSDPKYSYRRDVDYCSGASIALPTTLLRQLGGYDTSYENAYYEDTDLAMAVRKQGYRVMYEPSSVVTHYEHASYSEGAQGPATQLIKNNGVRFQKKWSNELLSFQTPKHFQNTDSSSQLRKPLHLGIVVIIDDFPRWKHDSGALRLHNIVQYFLKKNLRVVLVTDNHDVEHFYLEDMARSGVQVIATSNPVLHSYLKYIEQEIAFAYVARVHYMSFFLNSLAHLLPQTPLIYDTVDLHFLRNEREQHLLGKTPRHRELALQKSRAEELSYIDAADVTIVVSHAEENYLRELGHGENVAVVPNVHAPSDVMHDLPRTGMLFVGNYHHRPNLDAMQWFLTEVYPLIQQQAGDVPVTIVGAPTPKQLESKLFPAVAAVGWVDDLSPYYARARVALAPLRFGAGVKGKIGEAWSHGVPVVMTEVGAEGMQVVHGKTALVANEPESFAQAVLQLLNDDTLWFSLSEQGRMHVSAHFGTTSFESALDEVVFSILENDASPEPEPEPEPHHTPMQLKGS